MASMRLDKFLSNAGCGTRTEVKQLLKKGQVLVNEIPASRPEAKVDPDKDRIVCQGKPIRLTGTVLYMMNKPAGYLSATRDERQKVVLELVRPEEREGNFPAGRLDIDTEGFLLLTNDGALAHALLSPGKHVEKTYFARVRGRVTEQDCIQFSQGLDIGEKRNTLPAELRILAVEEDNIQDNTFSQEKNASFPVSLVEVTVCEGKFHQIKRMFEAVGKKVLYLKRISMGGVALDPALGPGEYRSLTAEEEKLLRRENMMQG